MKKILSWIFRGKQHAVEVEYSATDGGFIWSSGQFSGTANSPGEALDKAKLEIYNKEIRHG